METDSTTTMLKQVFVALKNIRCSDNQFRKCKLAFYLLIKPVYFSGLLCNKNLKVLLYFYQRITSKSLSLVYCDNIVYYYSTIIQECEMKHLILSRRDVNCNWEAASQFSVFDSFTSFFGHWVQQIYETTRQKIHTTSLNEMVNWTDEQSVSRIRWRAVLCVATLPIWVIWNSSE